MKKIAGTRLIAAILIFLVPLLVSIVVSFVKPSFPKFSVCMNNANIETIKHLNAQKELEYQRLSELRKLQQKNKLEEGKKEQEEIKKLLSEVSINDLLEKGHGKLSKEQCDLLKSRTSLVEWAKKIRHDNPTTILVHYDNCEFITIKDNGGSNHWDFVPASLDDSKRYYSWYNNKWGWNPRQGGLVYVNGKWSPSAFHGCPHGDGLTSSGLSQIGPAEYCSTSEGYSVVRGGHFCLHFKGSIVHAGSGKPNAAAQKEITRVLEDSEKYK